MRRTKADRWERMAERAVDNHNGTFPESMIAQMLRLEHRAVVRIIKRAQSDYIDSEYRQVCQEILDILKRRAR